MTAIPARRQQRNGGYGHGRAIDITSAEGDFKCDLALDRRPWAKFRVAPAHAQR